MKSNPKRLPRRNPPFDKSAATGLGVAHRTKRAAILAGLRLLEADESAALRARVAALEAERAATAARLTAATAKVQEATPALAQVRTDLKAERAAHRETHRSLRDAKATICQTKTTVAAPTADRDRLLALLPHHAWCGSCGKLVPEAEWAEKPARGGVDVYHEPDGYRPKATLLSPATVLFWRATPMPTEAVEVVGRRRTENSRNPRFPHGSSP